MHMYTMKNKLLFSRCTLHHPAAAALEEWISAKDYFDDKPFVGPKWHVPSDEEIQFANELINLHFKSALDDLLRICQTKIHSDSGNGHILFLYQKKKKQRQKEYSRPVKCFPLICKLCAFLVD